MVGSAWLLQRQIKFGISFHRRGRRSRQPTLFDSSPSSLGPGAQLGELTKSAG